MELSLIRQPSWRGATLGSLSIDNKWFCWTLEDQIREIPGVPVDQWKIQKVTAIPAGRYRVAVTRSARFGVDLPLLFDVPGYIGIRIHSGNVIEDTDGCILTGLKKAYRSVSWSRKAIGLLVPLLGHSTHWITVTNPPEEVVS